ncbi:Leukocyte immunoglobulin-like receptor subfamily A member 6 [Microtus ochrogaster]|uniref:Leukocyte immunoglobulin-like receptor subfamily A member 6 n=1 Tax=Microtus ochrogaster TaxID=79684 RepID=A0A8J6G184_MICOH|nr:Leukocyte immunoglobulin-like receptor subfamily A member 6 [Microtus ochrogaster]
MGKPTLRAQPGSVMTSGMQLTISCEGTSSAQEYYLYKEGSPDPWRQQSPLEHGNKAEFFFPSFHPNEAGRYRCYYRTHTGWSERSDFLDLMVTGFYRKPSLSALPSPVVRFGGNVTLECISQLGYDGFSLTKEEQQKISWTLDSQYIYSKNNFRALFSVGPVTSGHRRTFRCYGYYLNKSQVWSEPSDPLELLVSEIMGKPTLRAQPGSVMTSGMQLTISCEGTSSAQEYYLYKEGSPDPWRQQSPLEHGNKAEFFFPSFHPNEAGRYRCYYRTHTGWSERSDFLDLMVTGFYRKPSLSALPSPVVRFGGNVTLECISQLGYDGFSLTKEEQQKISWTLDSQYIYSKNNFRALFSVGPVTSGHRRTFRCYGYYLNKSQVWSEPSDPLELLVSGEEA